MGEQPHRGGIDAGPVDQLIPARRRVEQNVERVGAHVADRHDVVGVHHVVDQRDVLVAYALDVVLAVAVLQQGGALQRLGGHDPAAVVVLEVVARAQGAGRARRRHEGGQPGARPVGGHMLVEPLQGGSSDAVVAQMVGELRELVDDHVGGIEGHLVAGVVDLLHVGLGAGRAHDVVGRVERPLLEPVETGLAHARGQHGHAPAVHDPADGHTAACVVAGGGPHRPVPCRVELAGDQARGQAGVGGQHLVGPDHREAVAQGQHYAGVHAGHLRG